MGLGDEYKIKCVQKLKENFESHIILTYGKHEVEHRNVGPEMI